MASQLVNDVPDSVSVGRVLAALFSAEGKLPSDTVIFILLASVPFSSVTVSSVEQPLNVINNAQAISPTFNNLLFIIFFAFFVIHLKVTGIGMILITTSISNFSF